MRPCTWPHLLHLVTNGNVGQTPWPGYLNTWLVALRSKVSVKSRQPHNDPISFLGCVEMAQY